MTGKLNKKQKEVLKVLDEVYPASLRKEVILEKLSYKADDILADVKLLEENKLVELESLLGDTFPSFLTITPKGKEKLQENFITRLKESAYDNPLAVIAILVTLLLGVYTLDLQKEKAVLEQPLLITPDTRIQGNSIAELKFVVKNPSHSTDYYYVSGSCKPDIPDLLSQPPLGEKNDRNIKQNELPERESPNRSDAPLIIQPTQNRETAIPAGGEITLYCSNTYVKNPAKDVITYINVCVNIRNIPQPICNSMQVTILKN